MNDLISRETMKDLIDITTWYHQNRNKDMVAGASDEETAWFKAKDVFKAIENVPTVQPIIHCAECEWFQCNMPPDGYLPEGVDEFECRHWCGGCDPIDFCSYARRRENE